jgi:hypothetical protein
MPIALPPLRERHGNVPRLASYFVDVYNREFKKRIRGLNMNAATGEARVTAIAAVVNELVQQHRAMHGRMGQMHEQMMIGGRGRMMRQ